jgi:hypothetical protein
MKYLTVFLKPILIIISTSLLYITLVKPARLIANNKIYYPLISAIFSDYKVSLPSNNTASIIMNQNNLTNNLWIAFPFGGFYIIPAVLLAFKRKWDFVRKLTYYHLILSLIPFIFLMPIFNKVINSIPFDLFQQLTIALGIIFTILAGKDYLKNYKLF